MNTTVRTLCVLATLCCVSCTSKLTAENFEFLGSRKVPSSLDGKEFEEYMYHISILPGVWMTGAAGCVDVFGPRGHLVSIESQDELIWLVQYIERSGFGGHSYWTSGQFLANEQDWFWAGTGERINKFWWGENQPVPFPNGAYRIMLDHSSEFTATWNSVDGNTVHMYLCEVNSTAPIDPLHPCNEFSDSQFECLVSNLSCSYCHSDSFTGSRCDLPQNLISNGCPAKNQCPNGGEVVAAPFKLTPETPTYTTSKMALCVNQTVKFNVTFTLDAVASPLDLYILMDFSASMKDDKDNVVRLSSDLISMGTNLSTNFRIGFGTHVDKQSDGNDDYSFWNHLSLTSNYSGFEDAIVALTIRKGVDIPESQLEGLFQASACVDQIQWRNDSRRFLLLLTDAPYHMVGDAQLPAFNGSCSLDTTGKYTLDNILDYPSETQVIDIMKANQIVPIFAVVPDSRIHYRNLNTLIQPSGLANLTSDSSNILQVLDEQYKEINTRIEVNQEGGSGDESGLELKFNSKCNGEIDKETNKCEDLGADLLEVTFGVEMTFKSCPANNNKDQMVRIRAAGMPLYFDAVLEIIC